MQENIMALQKSRGVINMIGLFITVFFFAGLITVISLWTLMIKDIFCK